MTDERPMGQVVQLPRGIRNGNPGNIRHAGDDWKGMAERQPDAAFVTFDDERWGLRAMMKILLSYYWRRRLETVRGIIHRWAPPVENATEAYVAAVCRRMKVEPDAKVNVSRPDVLIPLCKAIVIHENGPGPRTRGEAWYPDEMYALAAELALGRGGA